MSTLMSEWTDAQGDTWLPGGFLATSPRGATTAVDGGSFAVTWSGASLILLAEAQNPNIIRSKFRMVTVEIDDSQDPPVQVGPAYDPWAGLCETPEIDNDPSNPTITLNVSSPMLDLKRIRPVILKGAERMRDVDPGLR